VLLTSAGGGLRNRFSAVTGGGSDLAGALFPAPPKKLAKPKTPKMSPNAAADLLPHSVPRFSVEQKSQKRRLVRSPHSARSIRSPQLQQYFGR
jgi:hypothetical protein